MADNGGWEDRSDIFADSDGEAKDDRAQGQVKGKKTKVFNVNEKLSVPQGFFFPPGYLIWRFLHRGKQLDVDFRDFTISQKHVLKAGWSYSGKRLLTKLSAAEETKC